MRTYNLKNGIKLIYENRNNSITSFCIGFKAGALMEDREELGLAHVVEHVIFKGTAKRNEFDINRELDETFGFNNAMTNFPYAIYYGTTLSEDFERGLDIYSDILLNPAFNKEGFKEEIDIICEELREWKDDKYQLCEDELLFNAFPNRRIKKCIIGEEASIRGFSIEDVKDFYNKYYVPNNCVISVVSSLDFQEVKNIIYKYFGQWQEKNLSLKEDCYESNVNGIFTKEELGSKGAKIQYAFPIHELNNKEIEALKVFNVKFGEGTSSLLYDKIRTENGLAYEVASYIKNEAGIKLYIICLGTSTKNINKSIKLIDELISQVKREENLFLQKEIEKIQKIIKVKSELKLEKSIELSKELTTSEIMFEKQETYGIEARKIASEDVYAVVEKVLKHPTIEILC